MNEIMEKVFRVADIRKFEQQVTKGDISYSRMVELMNEMAHTHYVVNKNCNLQNVTNRALLLKIERLEADNKLLNFMVENGLGEEDMINDITYPHEL
jgi:CRISPR/Cas system endoribonuclease Cas6 (RAMP superfamily)